MNKYASFRLIRSLGLVAALAAVGALAACGTDPEPTPTSPPPAPTATPIPPTATPTPVPPEPDAGATPMPQPTATATPRPEPTPTPPPAPDVPTLPATIVDADGNEVVVEDVSRIVVLNGDFVEVVYALGLGANVVAVDISATYPAEALRLPKIGYQRALNAEGILAMGPTVVIGNTDAGPAEVIEQVRSTGVPVVIIEATTTLDGVARKIRGIAQALGVPERGETIAVTVEQEIAEVQALVAQVDDAERPTAVFLYPQGLGIDSLILAGANDITSELLEVSGAISGARVAGIRAPFVPLNAEALVATNPDCIVLFTSAIEAAGGIEKFSAIPAVAQTTAAEQGCIHDFDGQYIAGGGPRTGQAMMDLFEVLHPDLAGG